VAVGLPFFVVSTSSPLLQKWFAATGHPAGRDPYFLYGASNLGSMLALVAYPLLVEPNLTLAVQSRLWAGGYVGLALLTLGCAAVLWRSRPDGSAAADAEDAPPERVTGRRRGRWVLLAFVPSSLMQGVTTYLSSDIAAVPLFWVLPLALYLLSFILVFAQRPPLPHAALARALPLVLTPLVMLLAMRATEPLPVLMLLHLGTLFLTAMVCHGEMARDRPSPQRLTEFYLWMSVGGVLGGAFNALLAPVVFTYVVEYPIALALACLVLPRRADAAKEPVFTPRDVTLPAALALLTAGLVLLGQKYFLQSAPAAAGLMFGLPALLCFFFSQRPLRFALGVAALLLTSLFYGTGDRTLYARRSFFGIHRVTQDPKGRFHSLSHGRTLHGRQSRDPALSRVPLTYYHPTSPIGQVFALCPVARQAPVAVVGLGIGSLATYGQAGQPWTFYEIDPVVEQIARNPRYFTYLHESPASVEVVLGDARLSLAAARNGQFGLIVLDAYSSDAIPVHLVTREALRLYTQKLATGGLLAFHISNLHLDLRPVFANLARDAGLECRVRNDTAVSTQETEEGKTGSLWLVMARRPADLASLAADPRWQHDPGQPGAPVWTDQFSSVLSVFTWN